jgi:glycine/D-amino acid oxidase-like deaminating enzyme
LRNNNRLRESVFELSKLRPNDRGIEYSDIRARYIIFCDGKSSALNPYFDKLPFALNKGEGLLVEINGLPHHAVFKKGMSLVPYRENIFWLGSSYEWSFENDQPSESFRSQAENWLNHFLKSPHHIIEHFAAIRPATLERRPFVGFHPLHPQIGILNGLGTKGCSLAPYFATQLADNLRERKEINPLVDIKRFGKILARQT